MILSTCKKIKDSKLASNGDSIVSKSAELTVSGRIILVGSYSECAERFSRVSAMLNREPTDLYLDSWRW